MSSLRVVSVRTGQEPERAIIALLCDGDRMHCLTACGLNVRPHYEIGRPPALRIMPPSHGAWPAALYVGPTRRERIAAWWQEHRWMLLRNVLLTISFIIAYLALNAIITGLVSVADWFVRP